MSMLVIMSGGSRVTDESGLTDAVTTLVIMSGGSRGTVVVTSGGAAGPVLSELLDPILPTVGGGRWGNCTI